MCLRPIWLVRRHHVHLGVREMALPGSRYGPLRAPSCGVALSGKPDADLVIKSLDMAHEQRGKHQGLLFHSDQVSQYGSRQFRQ